MEHNFFLTNSESQIIAITTAQQFGAGVVLALGTWPLPDCVGDYVLGTSNSMSTAANGQERVDELWTLKVDSLEGYDESITYADIGIESSLLSTGVLFSLDLLPIGVFAVSLPTFVPNQEKTVLSYIVDVLCNRGHFAMVVTSDGRNLVDEGIEKL
ncbi:MAG: hypothetical protein V1704_03670 [Candidatus Vogelbacteria bacterium]